jgi:hypothetical protein
MITASRLLAWLHLGELRHPLRAAHASGWNLVGIMIEGGDEDGGPSRTTHKCFWLPRSSNETHALCFEMLAVDLNLSPDDVLKAAVKGIAASYWEASSPFDNHHARPVAFGYEHLPASDGVVGQSHVRT